MTTTLDMLIDVWRIGVFTVACLAYAAETFGHLGFETALLIIAMMTCNLVLLND